MSAEKNRRILVIDDNRLIHDDFRKILADAATPSRISQLETALFGAEPAPGDDRYVVESAYQGLEGVEMVKSALSAGEPYALAFVDMRMPPDLDGVQTVERIWEVDDEIQIVICTAYSDYTWEDLHSRLGGTDRLLFLKKPFDVVEVRQLAATLTQKWHTARRAEALRLALQEDIEERKKVERLKDEIVATVSHELRTPLTSIRGALGLLAGGVLGLLPEDALGVVQIARSNVDRLIRLINDILDLEKLEAGKLELKIGPIETAQLMTATLDGIRGTAVEAGVSLHTRVNASESIEGDEDRLVQVLTNLVSNAIRFSPRGGAVDIEVAAVGADLLRFSVTDRGEGIAEEHVPMLFGKFQQLASSDARGKGGTGLGLAISKAIVEQHGGQIGVESCVGQGSTFWFELPRPAASPPLNTRNSA